MAYKSFWSPGTALLGAPQRLAYRSPGRRPTLWLTSMFWIANYLLLMLQAYLSGCEEFWAVAAVRAVVLVFGVTLCFLIMTLLDRFSPRSFRRRAIIVALLAPLAAVTCFWATHFGYAALDPSLLSEPILWAKALWYLAYWTWFFLAWGGLYLALTYSSDAAEEQQRSSDLQSVARAANLRALHNQVNPHFLFNGLNSISALMLEGQLATADKMIAKLADFFRLTLAVDRQQDLALEEEIALQRAYLEIEQQRFPDLTVMIDLPDECRRAAVPPLILQPIVENAVKYGVAGSPPPARIAISARATAGTLHLEVRDWGIASAKRAGPTGNGIGLENVRERLHQRFDRLARMSAMRYSEGGFVLAIEMPMVLLP